MWVNGVAPYGTCCFVKIDESANMHLDPRITSDVAWHMGGPGTLLRTIVVPTRSFHQKECVETISEMLVRPETNQARHRLAFRALWKWPDRATLEGEIGS